jgi:hypothetical protein
MIDVRSTPEKPLGFLNDWDMAKWERDFREGATQPGVSVSGARFCTKYPATQSSAQGNMAIHLFSSLTVSYQACGGGR